MAPAYIYELWDGETRNLLGTYPSEEAALAVVRNTVRKHGPGAVASLFLGREDSTGRSTLIAEGDGLAQRAEAAVDAEQQSATATPVGHDTSDS